MNKPSNSPLPGQGTLGLNQLVDDPLVCEAEIAKVLYPVVIEAHVPEQDEFLLGLVQQEHLHLVLGCLLLLLLLPFASFFGYYGLIQLGV